MSRILELSVSVLKRGSRPPGKDIGTSLPSLVLGSVVAIAVEFLFYGAYAVLYGVCIHSLIRRKPAGRKWQLVLMSTLFVLATIVTVLFVAETVTHILADFHCRHQFHDNHPGQGSGSQCEKILNNALGVEVDAPVEKLKLSIECFFVFANVFGDGILIYRLYLIWNNWKRITYIPIAASLVNSILAVIGIRLSYAVDSDTVALHFTIYQLYLALNVVLNVLLTALIAGRVWFIRREAEVILGRAVRERYGMAITLCMESGVLYPIGLILFLSLQLGLSSLDFFPILVQVVGIAPTLITVRSSLGKSVDNVRQVVESQSVSLRSTMVDMDMETAEGAVVVTLPEGDYDTRRFPAKE
ncbi:hypothetical protein D9758_004675 [Tetrapyrgos nigripes]|uniref:Uncharacterized protein n=1 Tax=Tetrapyrgos nigripes TaxID=182062 RepID=A0A8H5H0D1_9AGAR|nr:hypothetical protein D9758_004675 [Tetrapyrgos nigripes]